MKAVHKRSIGVGILLSLVTCGIYAIYWMHLLVQNTRTLKKETGSCTRQMLCILFVPFYSHYWWYTRGSDVKRLCETPEHRIHPTGTLYLTLRILGLGIAAMAIMQHDFNALPLPAQQSDARRAWQCYWRQLPDMMRYLLLELVIYVMAFTPLLFLAEPATQAGALLCPVLWVLLVLPARQNAAVMLQAALRGERIFDVCLVSFAHYGRKLLAGLKRACFLLLWALPGLGATLRAVQLWQQAGVQGQNDGFTLLIRIRDELGGGNLVRGALILVLVYAALWSILALGCSFHAGARHSYALGDKRTVRGHHAGQLVHWLAAQLLLLPWLAVAVGVMVSYAPFVIDALQHFALSSLPSPKPYVLTLGIATLVLLLPVLPLRQLMVAAYTARIVDHTEDEA